MVGVCAPSARAEEHYGAQNRGWNGLSSFVDLARGMGQDVATTPVLDWSQVKDGDIVMMLYPTAPLDPGHIAAFLHAGGHLVLADDFGTAGETLARLGLLRNTEPPSSEKRYLGLPHASLAFPYAGHPLGTDVVELVTNHPSTIPDAGTYDVAFAFTGGEAVVASSDIGRGRIVVISDPSIFINRMLEFPGNAQFSVNLLRYLTKGSPGTLHLSTGDMVFIGRPAPPPPEADAARGGGLIATLNQALDELNEYVLTPFGARAVAGIALTILVLLVIGALPVRRGYHPDGSWLRIPTESATLVPHAVSEKARSSKNYVVPAAILRNAVDMLLARHLALDLPLLRHSGLELTQRMVGRHGQAAGAALADVLASLSDVPPLAEASLPWAQFRLGARDFRLLERRVDKLCSTLGEPTREMPS